MALLPVQGGEGMKKSGHVPLLRNADKETENRTTDEVKRKFIETVRR
jgi:hypothetical protein